MPCCPVLGSPPACKEKRGSATGGQVDPRPPPWLLAQRCCCCGCVCWQGSGGGAKGPPGVVGSTYRGSNLGPLSSDQGLQAAATAGLALPAPGLFKLAGAVDTPDLDALLGATWGRHGLPAGRPDGPARPHCDLRPGAGREAVSAAAGPPVRCGARPRAQQGALLGDLCPPNHPPGISEWDFICKQGLCRWD